MNVKGKVQDDVRLRSDIDRRFGLDVVRTSWTNYFLKNSPKGYVTGTLKVRVRKMRPKELGVFQKSGKLPERF